jgi:NAD(P)-dependent dehydrogenase (short-subunit alcohol dehydrogenase family)
VRVLQAVRGACALRDGQGKLRRFLAELRTSPEIVEASLGGDARELCESGALTPDHVIRTKNRMAWLERIPDEDEALHQLVARCVAAYQSEYERYFAAQCQAKGVTPVKLDSAPRLFLVADLGIVALGPTRGAARAAADIAEHSVRAKCLANALGRYAPIDEGHAFDMEYWSLQQKKLGTGPRPPLQGQVALVTGAGGAIGIGIADRLLAAGAAVAISDIDDARLAKVHALLAEKHDAGAIESLICDVADYGSVEAAFDEVSRRMGGIDLLVPNAGVAHVARIEDLEPKTFDRVLAVNLMGTFHVIKAAVPVFRRQGTGGNIVLISSKNVPDPGAAFGAYSASKAAAHQISKIAALELAELGVRVNMVNPDAVFGDEEVSSGLWDLIGPDRMKSRGLDPEGLKEYYRQRNLLKISVQAEHVGNIVVFFASEQTPTTGASFPVDGGVPAAFPR